MAIKLNVGPVYQVWFLVPTGTDPTPFRALLRIHAVRDIGSRSNSEGVYFEADIGESGLAPLKALCEAHKEGA